MSESEIRPGSRPEMQQESSLHDAVSNEHAGIGRVDRPARVPWGAVAVFVAVSFGLAWLIALPLWLRDSIEPGYAALFQALAGAMMYTPLLGMLAAVFVMKAPSEQRLRFLGMWPLRPVKRLVWFVVGALFAPLLLIVLCGLVAVAFGWLKLDLTHFSAFQQLLDQQLAGLGNESMAEAAKASLPPLGLLVLLQIAASPLNALFVSVLAFGEEIGWRGWLVPALRPLGVWPALLLSGAIWGLWHSPLILLGYNFNLTDWRGVAVMTIGCTLWGVLFGWVRLRSGSVWPAVIGHGALNASAGTMLLLADANVVPNMVLVNPLGVSGWIVVAAIAAMIALFGQRALQPPSIV